MGHTKSFSVATPANNDDFEFDESYFRQFYKPLSNLPTPPPSTRNSSASQSPRISVDDTVGPNSQFLGPFIRVICIKAIHLLAHLLYRTYNRLTVPP